MLPYVLALVIAFGSFAFYMAAFFFPEVHRKSDFIWSGVGFFYALVLWIGAGRITGAVLLSQMASVSLLGWLGWQTLSLRRELTLPNYKTEISPEVQEKLANSSVGKVGRKVVFQPVTRLFRKKQVETATPSVAPVPETTAITEPIPEDAEFIETPAEETLAAEVSLTEAIEEVKALAEEASPTAANQATEELPTPAETKAIQATEEVKALTEEVETVAASPAETAEVTTPSVEITEEPEATIAPETEKPVEREPVRDLSSTKIRPKRFGRVSGFLKTILSKPNAKAKTPQPSATTPKPEILPQETLSEDAIAQTVPVEGTETSEPTPPEIQATEQETAKPPEPPQEEAAAAETKPSESPELIRPNPPDPKLVEAAKQSPEPPESRETPETPIEEIAPESQLSPPAEPIGQGDPKDRETSLEDAQNSSDSENPPQQS